MSHKKNRSGAQPASKLICNESLEVLFACVPETGGGEWFDLQDFVTKLNSELGTKYEHAACLDVEERNKEMPEVLLESPGAPSMVIEKKVVAWPEDYCRQHSNFHALYNRFVSSLKGLSTRFDGTPFKLSIHENSLDGMTLHQVRNLADGLARQVYERECEAKGNSGIKGTHPINWHFGPHDPEEWGESASSQAIMVETIGRGQSFDREIEDLEPVDKKSLRQLVEARNEAAMARKLAALRGFAGSLDTAIGRTKKKFDRFDGHIKLLLLSFVGDSSNGVLDENLIELVATVKLPAEIDEVWVAYHNWISAWDYQIGWKRLR